MKVKKIVFRICAIALIAGFATSAYATDRIAVFSEIEKINTSWHDNSIELWINGIENGAHPRVLVGDELVYRGKADKPAFFAFILVDARGNTAVLKPDVLTGSIAEATRNFTFPTEEDRNSGQNTIKQGMPSGTETVFLLASDQFVPAGVFGLDSQSDYVNYGTELSEIVALVNRFNAHSKEMKVALIRYEYFVDSDIQFSTQFSNRTGRTPPFVPPVVVEAILKKRSDLDDIESE